MSDIKKEPALAATNTDLAQIVTTDNITQEQQKVNTIAMLDELVNEYDRIQKQYIDYVNHLYKKAVYPYKNMPVISHSISTKPSIQFQNFEDFSKAVEYIGAEVEILSVMGYRCYQFEYKGYTVCCFKERT